MIVPIPIEGLIVNFRRILAGASIIGALGLPASMLVLGVASAQPAPPPGEPVPAEPAPEQQPAEPQPQAQPRPDSIGGIEVPPDLSRVIYQNSGNLPSPIEMNVPVAIGLPDLALPGIGMSVLPVGIHPPDIHLPGVPQLPSLPNVFNLPAPPRF